MIFLKFLLFFFLTLSNHTLSYDHLNQLPYAEGPYGKATFKYDDLGNITQKTIGSETLNYSYGTDNKLASITGSQTISLAYDAKGNIVKKNNQLFAFDEANRLTVLINTDPKVTYQYDGNGHRTITQKGDDKTLSVHNKAGQLIYEETPTQKSTYLYLNQQLMARVDHEATGNEPTYYHTDLLGSPIAASNQQGNILWKQDYKPYGERLTKGNKDNHQWYTGKTEDKETGFIYLNARHYDPEMARFISPDPVYFTEQNTQSFNRYTYANNNPYLYKDPDGKAAETVFDAISLGLSIQQFARNPSWGNFGSVAFDSLATAIPFVPGGMGVMRSQYSGVRSLSNTLRDAGVSRSGRLEVINSFKEGSIESMMGTGKETLMRYYGGISQPSGRFLTSSFPSVGSARNSLALPPINSATEIAQFKLSAGATAFKGTVAPKFGYPGGGTQVFVPNLKDLTRIR